MTCGCCLEACPGLTPTVPFIGAGAISPVRGFNLQPTGGRHACERFEALMGEGSLAACGHAQHCVRACPKEIPLTFSVAEMGRQVTVHAAGQLLGD